MWVGLPSFELSRIVRNTERGVATTRGVEDPVFLDAAAYGIWHVVCQYRYQHPHWGLLSRSRFDARLIGFSHQLRVADSCDREYRLGMAY